MILRRPTAPPSLLLLLLCLPLALAQDNTSNFDCHLTTDNLTYDLTALAGEHTVTRTRTTPPSTMVDSVRFDLCADLKTLEGVKEDDQVCFRSAVTRTLTFERDIIVSHWHKSMSYENEPEGR
jgi:hypothetical protein